MYSIAGNPLLRLEAPLSPGCPGRHWGSLGSWVTVGSTECCIPPPTPCAFPLPRPGLELAKQPLHCPHCPFLSVTSTHSGISSSFCFLGELQRLPSPCGPAEVAQPMQFWCPGSMLLSSAWRTVLGCSWADQEEEEF